VPAEESPDKLTLMRAIVEQYLLKPFYGSCRMDKAVGADRKRIQRLMRLMGIKAISSKRKTTVRMTRLPGRHLRGLDQPCHVRCIRELYAAASLASSTS
jgi:hypothetical protein